MIEVIIAIMTSVLARAVLVFKVHFSSERRVGELAFMSSIRLLIILWKSPISLGFCASTDLDLHEQRAATSLCNIRPKAFTMAFLVVLFFIVLDAKEE